MRLVLTENITPEMTLGKNIYKKGCVYLRAGQRNICRYNERLKDLGVDYVYVYDELSADITIPEDVSEATRQKCQDSLRSAFGSIENNLPVDVSTFASPVKSLMDELLYNPDIQINLTDISTMDEYTFGHSVSTAVYSILIGQEVGLSRDELYDLALGAVLHDVGKVKLDPRILFKEGRLTDAEYDAIRCHPRYSYEILRYCRNMSNEAKMVAFTHHERLNGTGYPQGLTGAKLGKFSRIVAAADVFDALSTNRCYRKKWSTNKVADFMTKYAGTEFDETMVAALLKKIAIYPNGSEVLLSDGHLGLVVRQNLKVPFRPVVRVVRDHEGFWVEPYEVDLLKDLNITITASQLELQEARGEGEGHVTI